MSDVETLLREELEAMVLPPGNGSADWHDVERRAGGSRPRRKVVLGAAVALAVAFAAVALAQTLSHGFSAWLTGEPGKPASSAEQQAFARAIRSWQGFPQGTRLRRLAAATADGAVYTLYGFRGDGSLCLRLVVTGSQAAHGLVCQPLTELHSSPPAVVAAADFQVGTGQMVANGPFRFRLPAALVTYGVVADGVGKIEIAHSDGRRADVTPSGDAFLSVDTALSPTERVTEIKAVSGAAGATVPFSPAPGSLLGWAVAPPPAKPARGPSRVQVAVHGGGISWLAHREPRGVQVPKTVHDIVGVLPSVIFSREITPDPRAPERLVVSVLPTNGRFGHLRNPDQVCVDVVGGRYAPAGSSCWPAGRLFGAGPLAWGAGVDSAGEDVTIAGLASDQVARLRLFEANGATVAVALHDNGYLAEAALADYPVRLVAYDAGERVIGIVTLKPQQRQGPPPAALPVVNGDWKVIYRSSLATIWRGPSQGGRDCTVRVGPGGPGFVPPLCSPFTPLPATALGGMGADGRPTPTLTVQAGRDIASVVVRFRDGRTQTIPAVNGFAIARLAESVPGNVQNVLGLIASVSGVDRNGKVVVTQGTRRFAVPVGGSGRIASLAARRIKIDGRTCAVTPASPSLGGYRTGVFVQFLCWNGVLTLIGRSVPHAPWPKRTVWTRGAVTAVGPGSVSIRNRFPGIGQPAIVTCRTGASSPSTAGYSNGEAVQVFCAGGVLTGINRDIPH